MFNRDVYDYEVSIWTLQDGFITVLKPSETEIKGQIQDGKVTIKDDGTREFSFSIPMYLYQNGEMVENPAWYNTTNGNILINLRKLKVIFNKKTETEQVFEFIITKVTEEHQDDTLMCHVESEGLAFHELGKIGYQISLTPDDYIEEYNEWVASGKTDSNTQPWNNLNYWCDKVFAYVTGWKYEVQMDWNGYDQRDSTKIYEDALSILGPNEEKMRLLDVSESNVYNITQTIAELFGVFCRYEYEYDENYHIIDKKVIFYNNFIKESEGAYDLTYPYATNDVSREINSADVVTKMFVRPLEDSDTATGLIDIIDVEANTMKENYILNFDYLHDIGTITEEQYAAIDTYKAAMKDYNNQLIPIESEIVSLQEQKPKIEAQVTLAINAIRLDQQQLDAQNELLNALTNDEGYIVRGDNNPVQLIMREDKENSGSYYVNLTEHGIDPASVHIYREYQVIKGSGGSVVKPTQDNTGAELKTGRFEYDDYGELIRIRNLYAAPGATSGGYVYATYQYSPRMYYERVIETWTNRLEKDQNNRTYNENQLSALTERLNSCIDAQQDLIAKKQQAIADFNKMMGPALREGYWQPEDYTDYKDKYLNYYTFSPTSATIPHSRTNAFDSFVWDEKPFENEQSLYTSIGATQKQLAYPCIDLSQGELSKVLSKKDYIDQLSFLFYDKQYENIDQQEGKLRNFTIGSKCQFGFLKRSSGTIIPVLILTGMETIPGGLVGDSGHNSLVTTITSKGMYLGGLVVKTENITGDNDKVMQVAEWSKQVPTGAWINPSSTDTLVFPRIRISSLSLQTDESNLQLYYKGSSEPLKKYEDYSVLVRTDVENGKYITSNYITIKPELLLEDTIGKSARIAISYAISNANLSIYLDALAIAKENAYPKVSYSIKPNIFNSDFMKTLYARLNQIVHINDVDLHFQYVQGYISAMTLDLDHPWESDIEVKNYKNKFEDLFSTIVAQTEAMKKTGGTIANLTQVVSGGSISGNALQSSLIKVDLNYAFNNGTLTIDEENGIWGTSDAGVVAFRGGGIFLANEKDSSGNWLWNTGIVPQGINASLITSGQLDTNRVMIYAGDKLRFQFNSDGLYAYKSFFEDLDASNTSGWDPSTVTAVNNRLREGKDIDSGQFIKFDPNGIFFTLKKGAMVLNEKKSDYIVIGAKYYTYECTKSTTDTEDGQTMPVYEVIGHSREEGYGEQIDQIPAEFARVALTWDGFTIRNYNGERIFYISAESGDIYMRGNLIASNLNIVNNNGDLILFDDYIDASTQQIVDGIINDVQGHLFDISMKVDMLNEDFTDSLNYANDLLDGVQVNLKEVTERIDDLDETFNASLEDLNSLIEGAQAHIEKIETTDMLLSKVTSSDTVPMNYKIGDVWYKTSSDSTTEWDGVEYIAEKDRYSEDTDESHRLLDWVKVASKLSNAYLTIDETNGLISLGASSGIAIASGNPSDTSKPGGFIHFVTVSNSKNINKMMLDDDGIKIASGKRIDLYTSTAADGDDVKNGISLSGDNGIQISSTKKITLYAGTASDKQAYQGAAVELSPQRILFGVSNSGTTSSAVDIDDKGLVLTVGGKFTEGDGATVDGYSLFANGGMKITKDSIGLKVSSSLFWMDEDGLELGTTTYTSDPADSNRTNNLANQGSYVFIKRANGVEIGTSGSNNNPSVVSVQPQRVTVATRTGSSGSYSTSVFDIHPEKIILAGGGYDYGVNKNFSSSGILATTNSWDPSATLSGVRAETVALSGVRITQTDIGMSVTNSDMTKKNLIWMDEDGVEIGSVNITSSGSGSSRTYTTSKTKNAISTSAGGYVLIKHATGVEIGGGTNSSGTQITLTPEGRISAQVVASASSTNYAAFNLGTGTNGNYGFELETSGLLTIYKRYTSKFYPLQIYSEHGTVSTSYYDNTQIVLRNRWYSSNINYYRQLLLQMKTNVTNVISLDNVYPVDGTSTSVNYFKLERDGKLYCSSDGITLYKSGSFTDDTNASATSYTSKQIQDTIVGYITDTNTSSGYVTKLKLASGVTLNFKHATETTHSPTVTVANDTSWNTYKTSRKGTITPYCGTNRGTSQTYYVFKAAETGTSLTETSNARSDTVVFECGGVEKSRFSLSTYWDAAQKAATLSAPVSDATVQTMYLNGSITPTITLADGTLKTASSITYEAYKTDSSTGVLNTPTTHTKDDYVRFRAGGTGKGAFPLEAYWNGAQSAYADDAASKYYDKNTNYIKFVDTGTKQQIRIDDVLGKWTIIVTAQANGTAYAAIYKGNDLTTLQ